MRLSISVVIPNYNGCGLLKANLPSVYKALQFCDAEYEIIVADDASKDDSVSFIEQNYPEIILIKGHKNLGFSENINRGLRQAKKDLVFALNSDVFLDEKYFVDQVAYFEDPKVFGVMGALYDPNSEYPVSLNLFTYQSFWGFIKMKNLEGYRFDKSIPIFMLSGSNALIDRKKLVELDYFNTLFSPFYGEDLELSLRAGRLGWSCYYEPKSICYHQASSTINKFNKKKKVRNVARRNKLILHTLHLSGIQKSLFYLRMTTDFLTRFLFLDFGYYVSFFEYLKKRKDIFKIKERDRFIYSTADVLKLIDQRQQEKLR